MAQDEKKKFNLKDFDAIIFDWDGVIFDSIAAIAKSAVELCAKYGVCIDEEYYRKHYNEPWQNFYKAAGIELKEDEHKNFSDIYWELYEKNRLTASLFSDAPDALKALASRIKMGIVSASRAHTIHENLKSYDLDELFSDSDIYAQRNDKVREIREFCEKHFLSPDRVIMIGDLPSDIDYARKAGVHTGGLARTPQSEERLLKHKPDYIFYSLAELAN